MDIASLRQRLMRLENTHSSVFAGEIINSGLSCARCGWCCRENFSIRITKDILRPSNAISVFPEDIRRFMKGTGKQWDEIAQPDIYSCLNDGRNIRAIGWILLRSDNGDCIFYRNRTCMIYEWRPMICRCYPFFKGDGNLEVMHCEAKKSVINYETANQMAFLVKRYEMQKLRSYMKIILQLGEKLRSTDLCSLPADFNGEIIVCDGEGIKKLLLNLRLQP